MQDISVLLEALDGVRNDFTKGLLVVDADIDLDDYIEMMIDRHVLRAETAADREDPLAARVVIEVAIRDLLTDFDSSVVESASEEWTTAEYADTVLRSLMETQLPMPAR